MKSFSKIWIVVFNSVKIYGKFAPCPRLFCGVPLYSLSLHKSCCYLFHCKASSSLSNHAMHYNTLYSCFMYPALACPTFLYILTCYTKLLTTLSMKYRFNSKQMVKIGPKNSFCSFFSEVFQPRLPMPYDSCPNFLPNERSHRNT